ncbi:MAG: iron-regulated protein [Nannocystis sp.]|nr:imelysin family protein [Nannocystis sp.]MBA3547086.1 iron-regulated protein [Nannocystis sp.]
MAASTAKPLSIALLLALGCESSSAPSSPWEDAEVRAQASAATGQYAQVVAASYTDTLVAAEAMQAEIDAFLAAPSPAGLTAAREAWLAARELYGETEVFRFYEGPIDAEPDNLEGQINSWPLDEVYIDYVEGEPDGGIINDLTGYPTLDRALLVDLNGAGGEDDISTGWHAIEFLLWGQDLRADGPGERPHTDYLTTAEGTAANQDRRAEYLKIVTDLLLDDLRAVHDAWAPGAAYREEFVAADPQQALKNVLLGMGSLSGAELAGERMGVAYMTREQEDEHSCFSDNTHRDLYTNAVGIENVYLGRHGSTTGASLSSLVAGIDPALDETLRSQLHASVEAIAAIPAPFDQAIQAADGSPARQAVADAIAALKAQTASIAAVAAALEITLNLEE